MNELIKIQDHNSKKAVSARDLYDFLEISRDFTSWCKQMFEYGFEENKDFTPILGKSTGGRPSMDYALSLDCAKEISMLQRTPKGKQARLYFIECEKQFSRTIDTISRKDLARMLLEAEERKEALEAQNHRQALALKEAAPKVLFADAVTASEKSILIGELAKILKQNGIEIGQNRLFEWLRDKGYLCVRGESYNQPTQRAMELGLFEIKKVNVNPPDKPGFTMVTTKVTPKGQIYFINKFLTAA